MFVGKAPEESDQWRAESLLVGSERWTSEDTPQTEFRFCDFKQQSLLVVAVCSLSDRPDLEDIISFLLRPSQSTTPRPHPNTIGDAPVFNRRMLSVGRSSSPLHRPTDVFFPSRNGKRAFLKGPCSASGRPLPEPKMIENSGCLSCVCVCRHPRWKKGNNQARACDARTHRQNPCRIADRTYRATSRKKRMAETASVRIVLLGPSGE